MFTLYEYVLLRHVICIRYYAIAITSILGAQICIIVLCINICIVCKLRHQNYITTIIYYTLLV